MKGYHPSFLSIVINTKAWHNLNWDSYKQPFVPMEMSERISERSFLKILFPKKWEYLNIFLHSLCRSLSVFSSSFLSTSGLDLYQRQRAGRRGEELHFKGILVIHSDFPNGNLFIAKCLNHRIKNIIFPKLRIIHCLCKFSNGIEFFGPRNFLGENYWKRLESFSVIRFYS